MGCDVTSFTSEQMTLQLRAEDPMQVSQGDSPDIVSITLLREYFAKELPADGAGRAGVVEESEQVEEGPYVDPANPSADANTWGIEEEAEEEDAEEEEDEEVQAYVDPLNPSVDSSTWVVEPEAVVNPSTDPSEWNGQGEVVPEGREVLPGDAEADEAEVAIEETTEGAGEEGADEAEAGGADGGVPGDVDEDSGRLL